MWLLLALGYGYANDEQSLMTKSVEVVSFFNKVMGIVFVNRSFCRRVNLTSAKALSHPVKPQLKGFSPVCVLRWAVSVVL
jgi:hypothetical protein